MTSRRAVLARDSVTALKANGINASYIKVPGLSHNAIVETREFVSAIAELLE